MQEDPKEPLIRRVDWAVGAEPFPKLLQGDHDRLVQRRRGRPPKCGKKDAGISAEDQGNKLRTVSPSLSTTGREVTFYAAGGTQHWLDARLLCELVILPPASEDISAEMEND